MRRLTTLPTMTAAAMCCAPAALAGDVWDSGGANDFWTNGFNWNTTLQGQVPPANNGTANLSFPCFGGVVHQPLIDVPYSINSLTFGSGSGRYVILGGAELTIGAGGIINNDADIQSIIGTVKLAADQSWNAAVGPLGFDAVNLNGFELTCTGDFPIGLPSVIVGGGGGINVSGGIQVTMSGGNNNTYTGETDAHNGTLVLQKTGGALAVPGNLTINESEPATPAMVRLAGNEQISQGLGHMVHVYVGGLLDVNTRTETLDTLWLDGGIATVTTGKLVARSASVSGASALWSNPGILYVGDATTASMIVQAGGEVSADSGYVGNGTGGVGTLSVVGAGSKWGSTSMLIGRAGGTGTLSITNGGLVDVGNAYIGQLNPAVGTVTVTGAASMLDCSGNLNLGHDMQFGLSHGDGTLNVLNNGQALVGSYLLLGDGLLNIDSSGDVSVATDLTVASEGEVTVSGGGSLDVGGELTIDGGTFEMHSGATFSGIDRVYLSDGADVQVDTGATASAPWWFVGNGLGAPVTLHVDGPGSLLEATNCCIDVGHQGSTGTVTITGGGRIEVINGGIGSWGGGTGSLIIDGSDPAGNPSTCFGLSGPHIALSAGSHGTVHVLNGGLWTAGPLNIGAAGDATVLVSGADAQGDPSLLQTALVILSDQAGASAQVTIAAGGQMNSANMYLSSDGGTSTLTVTDPDSAMVQAGAATLVVGHATEGTAEINVQNGASFRTGTGAINIYATGEITIASGGVFDARGPITINSGGELNMLGGTLKAHALTGSLLNQAGTVAPGHSVGTLDITGNYTQQAGATLEIELGGIFPGDWDQLYAQGNALIDGTLHVVLIDGFQPVPGNSFTILTTNVGNVAGTFDTVIAPSGMDVTYSQHAITLTMTTLPCPADVSPNGGDGAVNINDLLEVINGWGSCALPCPPRCAADISPIPAGDCQININDLLEVINSWGPCP